VDVQNVLLKILRSRRLGDTDSDGAVALFPVADNPFSVHAISLRAARGPGSGAHPEGEDDKKPAKSDRQPTFRGSPGLALEMNLEVVTRRRQSALRILERAALARVLRSFLRRLRPFAKDRENSFEAQLAVFTGC